MTFQSRTAPTNGIRQHLVDLERLDPTFAGWTPQQLLDELLSTVPTFEDLVEVEDGYLRQS